MLSLFLAHPVYNAKSALPKEHGAPIKASITFFILSSDTTLTPVSPLHSSSNDVMLKIKENQRSIHNLLHMYILNRKQQIYLYIRTVSTKRPYV